MLGLESPSYGIADSQQANRVRLCRG